MTQITRNIGSATAGASSTRFYLSRDTSKSSEDILLPAETAVPSLVRGGSVTGPAATAIIPSSASGVYRILACADDRAVVTEITDTNNCFVGVQSVTVKCSWRIVSSATRTSHPAESARHSRPAPARLASSESGGIGVD